MGDGRRYCIFVPADRDGRGWWKLAEVLREAASSSGQAPSTMKIGHWSLSSQSYKEVLQKLRSLDLSRQSDRSANRATSSAGGVGAAGS